MEEKIWRKLWIFYLQWIKKQSMWQWNELLKWLRTGSRITENVLRIHWLLERNTEKYTSSLLWLERCSRVWSKACSKNFPNASLTKKKEFPGNKPILLHNWVTEFPYPLGSFIRFFFIKLMKSSVTWIVQLVQSKQSDGNHEREAVLQLQCLLFDNVKAGKKAAQKIFDIHFSYCKEIRTFTEKLRCNFPQRLDCTAGKRFLVECHQFLANHAPVVTVHKFQGLVKDFFELRFPSTPNG